MHPPPNYLECKLFIEDRVKGLSMDFCLKFLLFVRQQKHFHIGIRCAAHIQSWQLCSLDNSYQQLKWTESNTNIGGMGKDELAHNAALQDFSLFLSACNRPSFSKKWIWSQKANEASSIDSWNPITTDADSRKPGLYAQKRLLKGCWLQLNMEFRFAKGLQSNNFQLLKALVHYFSFQGMIYKWK